MASWEPSSIQSGASRNPASFAANETRQILILVVIFNRPDSVELTIVLVAEVEMSNVRLLEGKLTSEIGLLVIGFLRLSHRKKRGTVFGLRGEPEYQQAALRHLLNVCR